MRTLFLLCAVASLAAFPADRLHGQAVERETPVDGNYELSAVKVLPRLRNEREVTRSIRALYPPELKEAGIGGVVVLRYSVGENGRVDTTSISIISSTEPRLDPAARQVVRRMVFDPAMINNRPVRVWVEQPLTFYVEPRTPAPAPATEPAQAP